MLSARGQKRECGSEQTFERSETKQHNIKRMKQILETLVGRQSDEMRVESVALYSESASMFLL